MGSAADETTGLVRMAKEGDVQAFRALYEQFYKELYKYALSIMKDTFDAEDAVSDTVLAAFRQIGKLKNESAFKSWIFTILTNKCRRIYKSRHYDEQLDSLDIPVRTDMDNNLFVRMQFEKLDYESRAVISLSVFAGFTSDEIAEIIHKRPGSVRAIKSRAIAKLRNEIERNDIYE